MFPFSSKCANAHSANSMQVFVLHTCHDVGPHTNQAVARV